MTGKQFRITNPDFGIFSPAEGEPWERGSSQFIRWEIDSHAEKVKISYSIDKGISWETIECTAPNVGHYSWDVPDEAGPSNDCFIKIEDVAG